MSQKIKADVTLGRNLRRIRKANNLTQEQVVAKMQLLGLDISRSIYSQIECGTYNIKVTELVALKQIYDIEYNDFFSNISLAKKNS
jgi:transcriptional regulator with XRE-family HTH domain